jgi:hypothetical protein
MPWYNYLIVSYLLFQQFENVVQMLNTFDEYAGRKIDLLSSAEILVK